MDVNEADREDLKKLPYWVRCMKCKRPPTKTDWLIEVVPNSTALIHQSCAAGQGEIAGLNVGIKKEN